MGSQRFGTGSFVAVGVAVSVVLFVGCAHTLPAVPGKGGPAWTAIESQDFILWTDLHEPEGRSLLGELEDFRGILVDNVFAGAVRAPRKSIVVAFADPQDWNAFGKSNIAGFFIGGDRSPYRMPALFLPSAELVKEEYRSVSASRVALYESHTDPMEIRQHELTHMVMDALITDCPPWFDEGLASYFGSAKLDVKTGTVTYGAMPESMGTRLRSVRLLDIDEVVHARRGKDIHNTPFYTTSHLLVSFLFNEHPDELAEYVQALKAAPRAKRGEVWDKVFANFPAAEVQVELATWLRSGTVHVFQVRLSPHPDSASVKGAVTDADVYGSRALLFEVLGGKEQQPFILENLRSCVAADPTHVSCNLYLALLDRKGPIDAAAIVTAHPDDWRAWFLAAWQGETKHDVEQRKAATRKMCELISGESVPDNVRTLCSKP